MDPSSRNPPQPPPLFTATPSQILTTIRTLITNHHSAQSSITSKVLPPDATYGNTLLPLAHAENALYATSSLLLFHNAVSPDAATRDASSQARSLLHDAELESATNEALFTLVDAVYNDAAETRYLNPEARNYLHKKHKEFVKNGLRIAAGPNRDRFRTIRAEIETLTAEFAKNLAKADVSLYFTPRELDGFRPDALARLEAGDDSDPEKAGKLRIKIPLHLSQLLRTAHRPNTRRRARIAYDTRCAVNVPIFRRVVLLRHEAARLLGYPDHATLATEDKMAGSPAHVTSFLSSLREKLLQGGRDEKEHLLKLKRRDVEDERGEIYDGKLYTWDTAYYTNLLLREGYAVDHELIAEYFPLEQTVEGMLGIFERLFGMEFCEIVGKEARDALSSSGNGEDIVWHEDVRLFSAWDSAGEGGEFLGYLYLDLYHRDGKYGNPANFSLVPGFTNPDQTRTYSSTALLCSFPPPSPSPSSSSPSPTLLRHTDVVTLFHELGHAIHDLVSRTLFARFHGPMGTVVDFGEAPSQMLENWCWNAEQLRGLGRHYSYLSEGCLKDWREKQVARGVLGKDGAGGGITQPPERIPETIVEGLVAAKHVGQGLGTLQQLFIGVFDMAVHQLPASTITQEERTATAAADAVEEEAAVDFTTLWNSLRREIVPTDDPPILTGDDANWGHGYTNIGHLMNEYDAGFYGYFL
ncbi:metallopeptidase MepB [Colletotrichum salicis]|uniref:Metallopeptidase MepB n=1 Tax=Colletotrichum salicis TaxID=1209931 RepID=A0A135THZ8_9PEZI|nr:metallopeptidase MepB [Colletotrichum salicis]